MRLKLEGLRYRKTHRSHDVDLDIDVCKKCNMTMTAIENFAIQCGQKWERRGHLITNFATGVTEQCRSENEAKRLSRKLQQDSLGLGRGEMRVIV